MFKNIKKRKELIERELELYRKEKLVSITLEIAQAHEKGAKEEQEYECTWHQNREVLNTKIAKLEAKKESYLSHLEKKLENYIAEYNAVNKAKDKTIQTLEDALRKAIEKIPTQVNNITTNNK